MLSKLLQRTQPLFACSHLTRKVAPLVHVRKFGPNMIPLNQYDVPIPRRLYLSYVLRTYYEIVPLFIVTCTSLTICLIHIIWATNHKVDVVFTTRSLKYLSRTMDLRNPDVHKMVIIHQRYDPWPEMQDALDKLHAAEHRAMAKAMSCPQTCTEN